MDCHPLRLTASILLLAAALALLSACSPQSKNGADQYFAGNALALAIASEQGDGEAITRLMKDEGVDPDKAFARDAGIPLVAWPLRAKNLDGLRALLENGADPNARAYKTVDGRKLGYNNAMVYAAKMDDPRFLELLLKHGGDPNTRNSANETLLLQAFLSGNQWKNIQVLIENGANINESSLDLGDDTVLSWYTTRGGFDYAYWLLEHGADPAIARPKGSSQPGRQKMVEDIYWEITTPANLPWQKKCQQWLADRNIPRSPMPEHIRRKREAFKFPSREEDIPLL
ncbi:ankyrin repeat domain-containing protein [Stenotrophomonas cyclobalanopsidis]|uniref:Ankyrin repeat domain-containing protein n=1 Tax=Stenotrophomonas cyclobalanopsidis TaxID=2771362 RepID=A0ABQ6SXU8_9GAMM|nr:ankyrin repeat domain-containing protein [Stenotrophomonas cyclobalanopsidis]KAA8995221.1 ankyrin repeat domain-containing protein [Stenotrophomonas cyclobalanopsidis]